MGRIKRLINNLSLKKSFVLYMLMFLLLAAGLSSITVNLAGHVRNQINLSYTDTVNQYTLSNSRGNVTVFLSDMEYTQKDKTIINICTYIEIWSIPFFFGLCIISSSLLFYRNKLKRPIELLGEASEKIASNDLDFHISYDSEDEMGKLCASFETMRRALEESSRAMWRTMEERKRLNAAFSHDLRTPLTVLRGYADFLKNYLPQGKVNEEKLISTVSTMSVHIARLEDYVRMMSEVQKLEDIKADLQEIETGLLFEQLRKTTEMLAANSGMEIDFINDVKETIIHLDGSIVTRVYET
jgi:signal transduction histidine kinase